MPVPYNNTMCINTDEWLQAGLSYDTYKNDKRSGHLQTLNRGCRSSQVLINVESIKKSDRKEAILRAFPSLTSGAGSIFLAKIKEDIEAREFYSSFKLADGRYLVPEKVNEYTANASVLNAIMAQVNERTSLRRALGGSTTGIWADAAETVNKIKAETGHSLPDNYRRLKKKAEDYKSTGYASLISGKWLNNNAAKVVEKDQEAALRQLLRKHQNFDNQQIANIYNIIAEGIQWAKITSTTVGNYRIKWEQETHTGRHGVTSFKNNRSMLIKRSAPSYPLYYWTVDGWDAELLYQKSEVNKSGGSVTTYHNRLTMVVVLDPCCKYPMGYAIGTHETPELIKAALRNAVNHTEELFGARHKVLQIQTDNYAKKKLQPIYEAISDYYTPARVHNAKSKVIEPYFARLNKKYCQLMPNWSGFGIASGSKKQPNAEMLNKLRHSFPDENGVRAQLTRVIEIERSATRERYLELYSEMPETDRRIITNEEYLMLMGETNGFTHHLTAAGIIITIGGVKYYYDSFDPKLRELAHLAWTVKYDPDDTSKALAISEDGSHRILLEEKYTQPMALVETTPESHRQRALVEGFNKQLENNIMAKMSDDYETVNELFNSHPQLNNTLAKLVLTDSAGQHKDRKSANRLALAGQKLLQQKSPKSEKPKRIEESKYLDDKVNISKYI